MYYHLNGEFYSTKTNRFLFSNRTNVYRGDPIPSDKRRRSLLRQGAPSCRPVIAGVGEAVGVSIQPCFIFKGCMLIENIEIDDDEGNSKGSYSTPT